MRKTNLIIIMLFTAIFLNATPIEYEYSDLKSFGIGCTKNNIVQILLNVDESIQEIVIGNESSFNIKYFPRANNSNSQQQIFIDTLENATNTKLIIITDKRVYKFDLLVIDEIEEDFFYFSYPQ